MTSVTRLGIMGVIVGILAALISAISVIGREARLVDVLILFCSGFAGGASLVSLIRRRSAS